MNDQAVALKPPRRSSSRPEEAPSPARHAEESAAGDLFDPPSATRREAVSGVAPPQGRRRRPGVPRTHDPEDVAANAHHLSKVLSHDSFRSWYEHCPRVGAPSFLRFCAYVLKSLTYAVDDPAELVGPVWEATDASFRSFDPALGGPETPIEGRFLKHWRFQFANAVRKALGRPRRAPLPLTTDVPPRDEGPSEGLLRVLCGNVAALPDDDRAIIEGRYFEGRPYAEIALGLHRRKIGVMKRHDRLLVELKATVLAGLEESGTGLGAGRHCSM